MTQREVIQGYSKELRLGSYLSEIYEEIDASTNGDFLMLLLHAVAQNREEERKNRYLNQAGFEIRKYLKDFDFSDIKLPESLPISELKEGSVFENKENLILYGRPGTGKTHLATALGIAACQKGMKVLYYKASRLVNMISQKAEDLRLFLNKLDKSDVLILNEWGYIPFERKGTQLLFEAVSSCYEKRSLVITTNLPFDEWNTIFYDEKLTMAMLDRIIHHCHLVTHEGQSYRLSHSKIR